MIMAARARGIVRITTCEKMHGHKKEKSSYNLKRCISQNAKGELELGEGTVLACSRFEKIGI